MTDHGDVLSAVSAGLLGSLVCGAILQGLGEIAVVAHLIGRQGALVGWLVLVVGAVLGAVGYARGVWLVPSLRFLAADPQTGAALGMAFGILSWLLVIIVVPRWVLIFGFTPPVQSAHWPSLVGLLVYGAIVGGLIPILRSQITA